MAHDLKSPVNNAVSLAGHVYNDNEFDNDYKSKDMIRLLIDQNQKVAGLIENLLYWSRSQMNRLDICKKQLNLKDLFDQAIDLLKMEIDSKDITVTNNIGNQVQCQADQFSIYTVIRNLLSNAVKFTFDEGRIVISEEKLDNEYRFSITDNGVGIPDDIREKLFRPDEKTTTRGTKNESGTGLGLLVCREFVENNVGRIDVSSRVKEGSTFRFILPC